MPEARALWEEWKAWNSCGQIGREITTLDILLYERLGEALAEATPRVVEVERTTSAAEEE